MILHGVKLEVLRKTSKYQKSTFALNVIAGRESMGLTAEKFAELADIPYPTLRDLEVGRTQGSLKTKTKIATALNTTVDQLHAPRSHSMITGADNRSNLLAQLITILPTLNEDQLNNILAMATRFAADTTSARDRSRSGR